jgi:hypothetical protein
MVATTPRWFTIIYLYRNTDNFKALIPHVFLSGLLGET